MKTLSAIMLIFIAGVCAFMAFGMTRKISYADTEYAHGVCDYRTVIEIGSNGKVELDDYCKQNGF